MLPSRCPPPSFAAHSLTSSMWMCPRQSGSSSFKCRVLQKRVAWAHQKGDELVPKVKKGARLQRRSEWRILGCSLRELAWPCKCVLWAQERCKVLRGWAVHGCCLGCTAVLSLQLQ